MIRQLFERGYELTVGTLRPWLLGILGKSSSRSGLVQTMYVLVIVGLMAGFINAVVFPVPNQGAIVYHGPGAQTIPEAIINSFIIVLGGAGIYMTYISGRQTTRTRAVNLYLGIALLLIFVSIFAGIGITIFK